MKLELDRIPAKIKEIEQDLAVFRGEFDALSVQLANSQKSCREMEADVAQSVEILKERETKLYMIKTNKEYQAAVTEIAERRRHDKELEKQTLALMAEIEALEAQVKEREPAVAARTEEAHQEKSALEAKATELKNKVEAAEQAWQQKTVGLDQELLKDFEEATQFQSDALSYLEGNNCQGCFMNVPPQLVIEVMRMERLLRCPNCQRLLFVQDLVEDPGIAPPTE